MIGNLALEEKGASQRVKPFLVPGPPVQQMAPSGVVETSGIVLSALGKT